MKVERFSAVLRDPVDSSELDQIEKDQIRFQSGRTYPLIDGAPVLIDERNSLFSIAGIMQKAETTQSRTYRESSSLKNWVRRRLLPAPSSDRQIESRYQHLANQIGDDSRVLVLGAGDKVEWYRELFRKADVVASDVHAQFAADMVLDAHCIPFAEETFDLVLAPQVLEHVIQPWRVAAEIERVLKVGGIAQIEVPFVFPVHGAPYDFYRFTPSALRTLFPRSALVTLDAPEGSFAAAAVSFSHAAVSLSGRRIPRMMLLAVSRFAVGWWRWFDRFVGQRSRSMPKGLAVTFAKDDRLRSQTELLEEVVTLGIA